MHKAALLRDQSVIQRDLLNLTCTWISARDLYEKPAWKRDFEHPLRQFPNLQEKVEQSRREKNYMQWQCIKNIIISALSKLFYVRAGKFYV